MTPPINPLHSKAVESSISWIGRHSNDDNDEVENSTIGIPNRNQRLNRNNDDMANRPHASLYHLMNRGALSSRNYTTNAVDRRESSLRNRNANDLLAASVGLDQSQRSRSSSNVRAILNEAIEVINNINCYFREGNDHGGTTGSNHNGNSNRPVSTSNTNEATSSNHNEQPFGTPQQQQRNGTSSSRPLNRHSPTQRPSSSSSHELDGGAKQ
jgi:hypothetical protein